MFTTTLTAETLATVLGKKPTDPEVARVLAVAVGLLADACDQTFRPIPPPVADDLVCRVARAVYDNTNKQSGGPATQLGGETIVRAPRDPLAPVVGILARYVVPL